MRRKLHLLLLIIFSFWLQISQADDNNNLNSFTVPVSSQSSSDLHAAFEKAFLGMLIKLSGNGDVASMKNVQAALPKVEKYIQQYRYTESGLQVIFNTKTLNAFLNEIGQPIWPNPRPNILLLLNETATPELADAVKASGENRGITLIFPKIDHIDSTDAASLQKLADAYQCSTVLLGEIETENNQTGLTKWTLAWNGQTWQWQDTNINPTTATMAAINKTADTLAKQMAVNPNSQAVQTTWLAVMDVTSLEKYQNMLQALYKLNVVTISTKEVGSQGVLLQIMTHAGNDSLQTALDKDVHFQAIQSMANQSVLSYRWVP
jgi:hypothetical protein